MTLELNFIRGQYGRLCILFPVYVETRLIVSLLVILDS